VSAHAFRRYHALDALRAAMMLLGLVLHSAVNYTQAGIPVWRYQDPQTTVLADLGVFFIHLFRMPVFFVVAGFFAAMLWQRDGLRGFLANRAKRVLLPLAIFWPLLLPPIVAGFSYASGRVTGVTDWTPLTSGAFLRPPSLTHLWFLYDLLLFYVAAALLLPLLARLPAGWCRRADDIFGRLATTITGALLLSAVTAATLLPMTKPALDTSTLLLPPARILIAYGVFFAFGLMLYRRRDVIEPFGAGWRLPMAVGAVASIAYLVTTVGQPFSNPTTLHVVGCALGGLSIWMLIFGIVGAFVSYLDRPSAVVRYFADAAYWMYLVHLPFTIWIPGLLATSPLPALVKFTIVLGATTLVTTVSYHYLVRSTAIGVLLNGRRYPRTLSHAQPVEERVVAAGPIA
jgi:glucans biosynthesis protein C